MTSHALLDEDVLFHEFGPPPEEEDLEHDWHVYEDIAQDARREFISEYPDNQFRFTTKVRRDHSSFFFTCEMTNEGLRAQECYKNDQCCDSRTGQLNKEATIIYWLHKSNNALQHRSWMEEPWATQILRKVVWTNRGYRTIQGTSTPDIPATRAMWNARFSIAARNPESLRQARNTWFPKTEKWASVMQQELMEVVLRT